MIIQFFHQEQELHIDGRIFRATCRVRNELNGRREKDQVVQTYSWFDQNARKAYMPRKFPTGMWKIGSPIWTKDPGYWPVKIPTNATRQVAIWDTDSRGYQEPSGKFQEESYYHLRFARDSISTLGCIRLDSEQDAIDIAEYIEKVLEGGEDIWLEVLVNKES